MRIEPDSIPWTFGVSNCRCVEYIQITYKERHLVYATSIIVDRHDDKIWIVVIQ